MLINSAKDLKVYKEAYALAMEIFEISKTWPPEERYSLTDQIRRSSRSSMQQPQRSVGKMLGSMLKNPESFILRL
jgi:hypothetical protein